MPTSIGGAKKPQISNLNELSEAYEECHRQVVQIKGRLRALSNAICGLSDGGPQCENEATPVAPGFVNQSRDTVNEIFSVLNDSKCLLSQMEGVCLSSDQCEKSCE